MLITCKHSKHSKLFERSHLSSLRGMRANPDTVSNDRFQSALEASVCFRNHPKFQASTAQAEPASQKVWRVSSTRLSQQVSNSHSTAKRRSHDEADHLSGRCAQVTTTWQKSLCQYDDRPEYCSALWCPAGGMVSDNFPPALQYIKKRLARKRLGLILG